MALIKCVAVKCTHNKQYECHCCQVDINRVGHCMDYEPTQSKEQPKKQPNKR